MFGRAEGRTPLGRHRRIWEDNIRMDLREIVWEVVHWIHLVQDRDHWRGNELTRFIKDGEFLC